MNFKQQIFGVLSLLALAQVIKADSFAIAPAKNSHICKSQFDGTILPHATDCQKFYVCVNYNPQEYNCDPNFHFDQTTQACVAGTECGGDLQGPTTCVDGTINAVEDDCFIFEICVKGQYQKLNCPVNYYFHAPQGICVPMQLDAQFQCGCVLPEHTVVANENNCETYFVCQAKTSVLKNCPLGQYYNSSVNACITDLEGICLMEPTKTPSAAKEELQVQQDNAKIECANLGKKNIQFQLFPYACNKFYICVNGILHEQHCPLGFFYDSYQKYCVVDLENICNLEQQNKLQQISEKDFHKTLKVSQTQENKAAILKLSARSLQ